MRWTKAAALLVSALPGAVAAQESTDARVQDALRRARGPLLDILGRHSGGELALACLAAAHDGVPVENPTFESALKRLAKSSLRGTYAVSLRLMVMANVPRFPDRDAIAKRDTKRLLSYQNAGHFGYDTRRARGDLSNTQYGALGMRAAASLGCKVSAARWKSLLSRVRRMQGRDGSFTYSGRNSANGYASMTVAGIAVMELCLQYLRLDSKKTAATRKAIDRAWDWMARSGDIGNPRARWCYYFHYGLERAAVLSDKTSIGTVDWYREGAEMLLGQQLPNGAWTSHRRRAGARPEPVSTAFAILFLRRRFQRVQGSAVTVRGTRARFLPEQASAKQIAESVALEVSRGLRAVPDLLRAMRSRNRARRRAAALAIRKITGKDFGFDPYRDPSESSAALRAAERWWVTEGRR